MGNVIAALVLVGIVSLIVWNCVANKHRGISPLCGGSCKSCNAPCESIRKATAAKGPYRITVGVEGMMCGMCENHINEAVRKAYGITKVCSSRKHKRTTLVSDTLIGESDLREVIGATGYTVTSYSVGAL